MRVAIVHYWLLNMRGGEKVIEALLRLFPQADLFTLFYDPSRVSKLIQSKRVTASFLNPLRRHYRSLLPLMPLALEQLDLRGYDLVISSESGPAKGVITHSSTRHVCYCHTPMRYLWDLYPDYAHEWVRGRMRRTLLAAFSHYLRMWDFAAAARVDQFIANSRNVQQRIQRTYRRDSTVIHPPVALDSFLWCQPEDYFLIVAELVAYKRLDLAVAACTRMGRKLRIVGDGPEYKSLRRIAGPTIEFCGRVDDAQLRDLYSRSRAFLQPGEEDFGIASVESLASGKPLIAFARGGVLEIAQQPLSGFFFSQPSIEALSEAIANFEQREEHIDPRQLFTDASRFSEQTFMDKMTLAVQTETHHFRR